MSLCASDSVAILPCDLQVVLHPPTDTPDEAAVINLFLTSAADTFSDVLGRCMSEALGSQSSGSPAGADLVLELADGTQVRVLDLSTPIALSLSALPQPCSRLIYTLARADGTAAGQGASTAKPGRRFSWLRLGNQVKRVVLLGIKVVVALELLSFGLGRVRLIRYLGRRERWGPGSSESDWDTSDDDGGSGGTSSEVADLLLSYLEDEASAKDLQGLNAEEVARGLRKIQPSDLKELGLEEEGGAEAAMEQLKQLAERLRQQEAVKS